MLRAFLASIRRKTAFWRADGAEASLASRREPLRVGFRPRAVVWLSLVLASALLLFLWYAFPGVPRELTMATAFPDSTYELYGQRYRRHFARLGLDLELRQTSGAIENLAHLRNPKSGVHIAFVNGGLLQGDPPGDLFSLGLVFETPFWLFYSSPQPLERVSQLKGRRIAIGAPGGTFRSISERVLGAVGIDSSSATILPIGGSDVVEAFASGKIDAALFGSRADDPFIKTLLKMPGIRILSFDRIAALTQRFPHLNKFELAQGGLDLAEDIPAQNLTLFSISTRVLVRHDLHPAVVTSLLDIMKKEHAGPSLFQRSGDFPKGVDDEYALAPVAVNYYKNGPSLMYSYIPLWLSGSALRLAAFLAAVVPLIIFVISFEPTLFKWIIRHRVRSYYRQMREIERQLPTMDAIEDLVSSKARLEQLDKSASLVQVPLRHSDSLFTLKIHLHLLRTRLAGRIEEVRARQRSG